MLVSSRYMEYTYFTKIFSNNINSALYISLLKVKQTRSSSKKKSVISIVISTHIFKEK